MIMQNTQQNIIISRPHIPTFPIILCMVSNAMALCRGRQARSNIYLHQLEMLLLDLHVTLAVCNLPAASPDMLLLRHQPLPMWSLGPVCKTQY